MEFTLYHKIQTMFKRDEKGRILEGQWTKPYFEMLASLPVWVFTEKIDGTNIRIMWDSEQKKVTIGGRTDNAQIPASLFQHLTETYTPEKFEAIYPDTSMIIYGEGYGKKIQKCGTAYLPDSVGFIAFDISIGGYWLDLPNFAEITTALNIPVTPVIGTGTLYDAIQMVKDGFQSHITTNELIAEGIVARPSTGLYGQDKQRIICKIKHCDFGK